MQGNTKTLGKKKEQGPPHADTLHHAKHVFLNVVAS